MDQPRLVTAQSMLLAGALWFSQASYACPTCGGKGFTKEMLLMTMGFTLLPLSIMLALAWRILREDEEGDRKNPPLSLGKKNPDVSR